MDSKGAPPILYVDDEAENRELFLLQFGDEFTVRTARGGEEALRIMQQEDIWMVLTDERMPGMRGIELLSRLHTSWPNTVRVIVSAYSDADRLLRAINQGHAHEYVVKPWDGDEMRALMLRGLAVAEQRRRLAAQAESAAALLRDQRLTHNPESIVGQSGGLRGTLEAARKSARTDATILIKGETGTGKELIARFIHESSPRASGPFIRVNCAALPEGVIESELFGHEQGAFTGAQRLHRGRFELANGGTLFLDEIGDISAKLQVSLLRVLQEREIERVGGSKPIPVDARVIAATHADLAGLVQAGRFREDLYYRLNVIPIFVPPLRERLEDLPALLQHFIHRYRPVGKTPHAGPDVHKALQSYLWPGNVRELENLVQRALVFSDGDELTIEDFNLHLAPAVPVREESRRKEEEQLRQLLLEHGGNCASAARALGIPRTTLISRARKFGLL